MIGEWSVPCIERISTLESRRIARLGVPGLLGDLQQDLGAHGLTVEIIGSLQGDQARDDFLSSVRPSFRAGTPVKFVADIVTATEVEKVVIDALDVEESNDAAGGFRYRVVLREYVEPPASEAPIDDLGSELGADLDASAALGLSGLELPDLLGDVPELGDPTPPVRSALEGAKSALSALTGPLKRLNESLAV